MRFIGVIVALSLVAAVAAVVGHGGAPPMYTVHPKGNSSLAQAKAFSRYSLYYPGLEIGGYPLVAVDRQVGPGAAPGEGGVDRVSFVYGTCQIRADLDSGSCTAPLELQIWPSCLRNPSAYPRLSPQESLVVRGAPAYLYENGSRLELTTGRVTAVFFGASRDILLEAAQSLRGVNVSLTKTAELPDPMELGSC
jgi:hypothetical protein